MSITTSASETSQTTAVSLSVAHDISLVQAQFPKISDKVTELWGSVELSIFLDSVLFDERGSRQGFPDATASALMRIYEKHISIIPSNNEGDIWTHIIGRLESPVKS